ncbi:FAD-dependent oxidoreductase [Actinokineospora bangkokensis]|uniref:ferredoxin--NADP(+) reductase n=1 Tax=Actinokineospora bangkokensis TaxID=1193682 RepID=A0A1Q9LNG0_9PSEU|nr:FAD-dependent oxidoreductase [Actinokineospora bangkokensis]OLR93524.1 ferredoxin-NADP reductase [Actinokineospora bangkokensis]
MAFAITQACCNDATCVSVCPVNCIHPTPDEPDFATAEMLYVDPATCIDCGACSDACPVDAIHPIDELTGALAAYADINAAYYADRARPVVDGPNFHAWSQPTFAHDIPSDMPALDVAVVGTGPAGMYAVQDLVLHTSASVTLFDRHPVPGGLVRFGVAPDHPSTKMIGETFARFHDHPRVRLRLGVEVGEDVSLDELRSRHDAVIYAVGAASARRLGIPGEDLPGSTTATTVVGWYNGHPDVPADVVDLSAERVVIVGTGNVALDVARILTADPAELAGTSIAPHALARLRSSKVREVVLVARRGPATAAYTAPELLALTARPDVDLVVDDHDPQVGQAIDEGTGKAGVLRGVTREAVDWSVPPRGDRKRIVLSFHRPPEAITGETGVRGLLAGGVEIATGQVISAIGYKGTPVAELPFDDLTGTVPNTAGRVEGLPGVYVVGWIKRGPSGGIGANRTCAQETVASLLSDVTSGALPVRARRRFASVLRRR